MDKKPHLHGGGSPGTESPFSRHTIKVETQGSSGVENRLSSEEIAAADYVILATGRGPVPDTLLRANETDSKPVCRLLFEKKNVPA